MSKSSPVQNCASKCTAKSLRSYRIREGIALARAQGTVWGRAASARAVENKLNAMSRALELRFHVVSIMATGNCRPTQVARALNAQSIPSTQGGSWYPASARRLIKRLGLDRNHPDVQAARVKWKAEMLPAQLAADTKGVPSGIDSK